MTPNAGAPSDSANVQFEQHDRQQEFAKAGTTAWTTLYTSWSEDDTSGAQYSAIIPQAMRMSVLDNYSWDLTIGDGLPGFTVSYEGEQRHTEYLRFGSKRGIEPLVVIQDHFGIRPRMLPQLCEEFRLYHNLWISPNGMEAYKVCDDGTEELVATATSRNVRVLTKYLRQFQAGRQADVVLFIDSIQYADGAIVADPLSMNRVVRTAEMSIRLDVGDSVPGLKRRFSRLLGKRVLAAPDVNRAGMWPFDERIESYQEFIISETVDGDVIRHTCDPNQLANYFGANPEAPHYLTPVFFKREVLQRYFELPEKYGIGDGRLTCGGLWSMHIDNDHPNYVVVFLGDLGRDLPESERPYWQTFNIAAPDAGLSTTAFDRSILGLFTAPKAPDLRFKATYDSLCKAWIEKYGWDLFKPLHAADTHVKLRLRIPLNESQAEFEDQVIGLTKLLVDSLNEKAIASLLAAKVDGEKGLGKLERWLQQSQYPFVERDMRFLRRLQLLRSKLAAHRKGSDFQRVLQAENVDSSKIQEVARLFVAADLLLRDLARHSGVSI